MLNVVVGDAEFGQGLVADPRVATVAFTGSTAVGRGLQTALAPLLPAHALLWHGEDTVPYECDGLTAYRERPLVVALPETAAQVAAVQALRELGVTGGEMTDGQRAALDRDGFFVVAAHGLANVPLGAGCLALLDRQVFVVEPDEDRAGDEDRRVRADDYADVHGEGEVTNDARTEDVHGQGHEEHRGAGQNGT